MRLFNRIVSDHHASQRIVGKFSRTRTLCSPMALAALASLLLPGCGGGGDDDGGENADGPPVQTNSPAVLDYLKALQAQGIAVPRELGDERALIITDPVTAQRTTVMGERDDRGNLTNLTEVQTVNAQGTTATEYVNETDRRYTVNNSTTLSVSKQAGGEWLLEFLDLETGTSFKTNLSEQAKPAVFPAEVGQARMRALQKLQATAAEPRLQTLGLGGASGSHANQIPVTVTTRSCGQVADALSAVKLNLNDGTGKFLGTYSTTRTGVGTYLGHIPDTAKLSSTSLESVKDAIENAAAVMAKACQVDAASPLLASQACLTVSSYIAASSLGLGTPVAVKFLAACEAAVLAGKVACKVQSAINAPVPEYLDPAAADIIPSLESILVKVVPDTIFNSTVTPFTVALPSNVNGESVPITANTTSVSASLFDDFVKVGELILNPASPSAGVDYSASTELQCVPFDSTASLTVVGTDGYTDQTTKSYAQAASRDTVSLMVPGADSGVRDTVTLTVTPRTSSPITRTGYLVFR